jgi:hypothetical protein
VTGLNTLNLEDCAKIVNSSTCPLPSLPSKIHLEKSLELQRSYAMLRKGNASSGHSWRPRNLPSPDEWRRRLRVRLRSHLETHAVTESLRFHSGLSSCHPV